MAQTNLGVKPRDNPKADRYMTKPNTDKPVAKTRPKKEVDKSEAEGTETEAPQPLMPEEDIPEHDKVCTNQTGLDKLSDVIKYGKEAGVIKVQGGELRAFASELKAQLPKSHMLYDVRGDRDIAKAYLIEGLSETLASVIRQGVHTPVTILLSPVGGEDEFCVVDGRHRVRIMQWLRDLRDVSDDEREDLLTGALGGTSQIRQAKLLNLKYRQNYRSDTDFMVPVTVVDPSTPQDQVIVKSIEANTSLKSGPCQLATKVARLMNEFGYNKTQMVRVCRANVATIDAAIEIARFAEKDLDAFTYMHRLNLPGPSCYVVMSAVEDIRVAGLEELTSKGKTGAKKNSVAKVYTGLADAANIYPWADGSVMAAADAKAEGKEVEGDPGESRVAQAAATGKTGRMVNYKQCVEWLDELGAEDLEFEQGEALLAAHEYAEADEPPTVEMTETAAISIAAAVMRATLACITTREPTELEKIGLSILAPPFTRD